MRSSTILVLTLRSLAQETIKNLVLSGVGRLIVMDDKEVTEMDLGAGLLFREDEGAVGLKRVEAALPQIQSLNPLVKIDPRPTLSPFQEGGSEEEMDAFLRDESVDLVCATDLTKKEMIKLNEACRRTGKLFYGAGSYGFIGYIFADLGQSYEWVMASGSASGSGQAGSANANTKMTKKKVDCRTLSEALGSSPFEGLTKNQTKETVPSIILGVQAVWEYQERHAGKLPQSEEEDLGELVEIAESMRKGLKINEKFMKEPPREVLAHLANGASHEFAPTAAILGGLLAQDILRALSRKEKPVMNFLAVDTMAGTGTTTRWGMGVEQEV
ncbi:hypothetical protein FFLO_05075 [Filobasidium floriforme]|uniref:Ubiquitin-like 1-activating enzyme E1A n=1 Tax=Filobasidium floriforme TaxID=5210 RepID=A0A8K0JJ54_9TREE|nr:hypothetical protein FFLO_05075 [Filobasidium floriforme]